MAPYSTEQILHVAIVNQTKQQNEPVANDDAEPRLADAASPRIGADAANVELLGATESPRVRFAAGSTPESDARFSPPELALSSNNVAHPGMARQMALNSSSEV